MSHVGLPENGRALPFIGGAYRPPESGAFERLFNPSTGSLLGEVAVGTPADANSAIEAAAAMEERWATTPGHERARILRAASDRLEADRETMARLIASEVGKPIRESRTEVDRAIGVLRLAADEIRHLIGESFPADAYPFPAGNEHRVLFTVRDPIGVVVAISPFNFPLNLLTHKVAPALAAGNPVVAKPTSAAPFTALRLAEHLHAAGLPSGVLNVVIGPGRTVGTTLIEHPRTRLITFTGSTEVGEGLAERAGRRAKRVILELGGLDPLVVLADAPLATVVPAVVRGTFGYSGQVCTASKRILVAEPIADAFGTALARAVAALKVGPALEETTDIGPLIDATALDRMDMFISDARARQATVLTGGERVRSTAGGNFFAPTVLDHVPSEARVAQEEPFGPIAPLIRFSNEEEAVRIANSTRYGLQASVYTNDLRGAFRFARRIRAGSVHVNDPTNLRWDALPFGGIKESGLGREGLRYAMEEMTEVKLITINYGP